MKAPGVATFAALSAIAAQGLAVIFAVRGIARCVPGSRRRFSEEAFATYDRHRYPPQCPCLALALMLLFLRRLEF